jgi:hypothetical protein
MKKTTLLKGITGLYVIFMIITTNMFAQVGIGTTSPHMQSSGFLDVSSTTQGMFT